MAKLRVEVGPLAAEATATDAAVSQLIADYIAAYNGPVDGTNQQRLNWFVRHLTGHVLGVSRGQRAVAAADAARQAVLDEEQVVWD
jgi:hypothetical protein